MSVYNEVYICVRHIYRHVFYYLIYTILLSFSTVLLFITVGNYMCTFDVIVKTDEVFRYVKKDVWNIRNNYITFEDEYCKRYSLFIDSIEKQYDLGRYTISSSMIEAMDNGATKRLNDVATLKINNSLLNHCKIKDKYGDIIQLNDNEIAIGSEYCNTLSIGDCVKDCFSRKEYKVAYIINDNNVWISEKFMDNSSLFSLKSFIIIPYNSNSYIESDLDINNNNVFYFGNKNVNKELALIKKLADENNIYISIYSYKEAAKEKVKDEFLDSGLYFVTLIIIVILNFMIFLIINLIIWNNKDVGILLSIGFIGKDIKRIMIIENIMVLIIASLISFVFITLFMDTILNSIIQIITFVLVWLLLLLITVLCSLLDYRIIKNDYPVKLMEH